MNNLCPQLDRLVARHGELRRSEEVGRRLAQDTSDWYTAKMAHARATAEAISALEAAGKWPPSRRLDELGAPVIDATVFNRRLCLDPKP